MFFLLRSFYVLLWRGSWGLELGFEFDLQLRLGLGLGFESQ